MRGVGKENIIPREPLKKHKGRDTCIPRPIKVIALAKRKGLAWGERIPPCTEEVPFFLC